MTAKVAKPSRIVLPRAVTSRAVSSIQSGPIGLAVSPGCRKASRIRSSNSWVRPRVTWLAIARNAQVEATTHREPSITASSWPPSHSMILTIFGRMRALSRSGRFGPGGWFRVA